MSQEERITRREFVAQTASAAVGLALSSTAVSASNRWQGANERLSIGIVGCGGRGRALMSEINQFSKELNAEITAVCDVWSRNLNAAAAQVKQWYGREPRALTNYEDLLALEDVDAVTIATPDFGHPRILINAVRAGKDAYVEKPMASTLAEANESLRAVKETGRVVQVGTQRRSDGRHIAAAEVVRSGALGTLSKVTISMNFNEPRWRRNFSHVKEADVDWKRYLMHLPWRPFDPSQYMQWHFYRDFTLGLPGLWMSHFIDLIPWFTGDPFPWNAVAHGGIYVWHDGREHADTQHALLEYPKGFLVSFEMRLGNSSGSGVYFYGTNGTLDCSAWKITGAGGGANKLKEEIVIKPQGNTHHMKNWLECLRSRQTPNADINAGYQHSIAGIMVAQSYWTGRRTVYDPTTQTIREG